MVAQFNSDSTIDNEISYEDLLVSIEASEERLSLLIAVCDDSNYRDRIIERYEAELQPDIRPYQVTLARGEPSLRAAIAELVQADEYLRNGGRAVLTVTGAEKLYFLKLGAERSEQEIFFGYLQWTREGLREFPFPIVLWVTNQILIYLMKKAPDFWSWRKGVFHFDSKKTVTISSQEIAPLRLFMNDGDLLSTDDKDPYFLPLEDLQQLIQQIEQQRGTKDPSLATLYFGMGQIYRRRLERGEFQDYQTEQALAIEYFRKAVALLEKLGLKAELTTSLNNLAELYDLQGRYSEAEPLYLQALELTQDLLGKDHPNVASILNNLAFLYGSQGRYSEAEPLYLQALELTQRLLGNNNPNIAISLNNLAGLYKSQGRYSEAEPLDLQALELTQRLLGNDHPYVSASLNNLAGLYKSQGRYSEAEPLYLQALELRQRLLGNDHPDIAVSLNNLAELYKSQGRYSEAEPLYLEALELTQRLLGNDHPSVATSLNNLAGLYDLQGRYSEAEPLYLQALELTQRLLGNDHPDMAISLNNLAGLYQSQGRYSEAEPLYLQALELRQRLLGNDHPSVANSLNNLAGLYQSQGRYSEAEPLYLQALELSERVLGANHPYSTTIRENLESMRAA